MLFNVCMVSSKARDKLNINQTATGIEAIYFD